MEYGWNQIEIFSEDVINGVVIKIKDNGIGIAREHQTKIFDKLYIFELTGILFLNDFEISLRGKLSILYGFNSWFKMVFIQ